LLFGLRPGLKSPIAFARPHWPSRRQSFKLTGNLAGCILCMSASDSPVPSQNFIRSNAVNALWPRTTIATAAIKNLLGATPFMRRSHTPDILADAPYLIFTKPAKSFTGQFLIDDTFLAGEGVTDFDA